MDEVTKAINHFSALMEDQNAKLDAVLEAVGDMQRKMADLPTRDEFNELKQDVKTIKAAVKVTNDDLVEHKRLPVHLAHEHAG
jgi:peptidoglycan hydrolase CwlO-like protein